MTSVGLRMLQDNRVRNSLIVLYILIVLGISAAAHADMKIQPVIPQQKIQLLTYHGELVQTLEGVSYLIVSENEYYELSSKADLSAYNGLEVYVKGFEVKYKVGPVLTVKSMDPLPDDQTVENKVAPLLVVFGISETAE